MSATDIVLIIGAVGLVINNTITNLKGIRKTEEVKQAVIQGNETLAKIDVATNGNYHILKNELKEMSSKFQHLQDVISSMTDSSKPGALKEATEAVAEIKAQLENKRAPEKK